MLTDYVSAGFDPAAFWGLTPRLYLLHMQGQAKGEERRAKRMVTGAWLAAMLFRAAKLPRLSRLLKDKPTQDGPGDTRHRLAALKASLPVETIQEWKARHGW